MSTSVQRGASMLPVRLPAVCGVGARANDLLLVPPTQPDDCRALLYFGGDVQDYVEVMSVHRDNRHYSRWSLEHTARQLAAHFPRHHVLVVRPSRMERKSLSCYDNFVPSNQAGVPDHVPSHGAIEHLQKLLENVVVRLKEMSASPLQPANEHRPQHTDSSSSTCHERTQSSGQAADSVARCSAALAPVLAAGVVRSAQSLPRCPLTLVGFSKGCVVLNQIVHEMHHHAASQQPPPEVTGLISRISSMWWLDGGHAGGAHTWITSKPLLQTLAALNIDIHVHVSPYQVRDAARPWIGREEKIFTSTLTKLGAKVSRHMHDGPAPESVLTHFSVLDKFAQAHKASTATTDHAPDDNT